MNPLLREIPADRDCSVELASKKRPSGVALRLVEAKMPEATTNTVPGYLAGTRTAGWMATARQLISIWLGRSRQRQALSQLPGWLLEDIGVTAEQALQESRKPFWRA